MIIFRYSMECLLSFIEIKQYQNYLIENDTNNILTEEQINNVKLENEIGFASNIPMSEIVERSFESKDADQMFSFKMKAYKLYKKYIEVDSEFEINISSSERTKFAFIANLSSFLKMNININDLLILFQESKKQMRLLLMYSLTRFKVTPEFEQIKEIFDDNTQQTIVIQEI